MSGDYKIPLNYKEGTYKAEEIKDFSGEVINMEYCGEGLLYKYIVPRYEREVRIYQECVNDNPIVTATYDSDGVIKYIQLHRDDTAEFAYINFKSYEHAKESILQFSNYWGDKLSDKILERKEKISRLFIEHFYDGQAVDFTAKIGTPEDMQDIFSRYGDGDDAIDNSGDYPYKNRIESDNYTLGIMLSCIEKRFCVEFYYLAVCVMTERIKNNVLDKLDKTDDFKFIEEEYD